MNAETGRAWRLRNPEKERERKLEEYHRNGYVRRRRRDLQEQRGKVLEQLRRLHA